MVQSLNSGPADFEVLALQVEVLQMSGSRGCQFIRFGKVLEPWQNARTSSCVRFRQFQEIGIVQVLNGTFAEWSFDEFYPSALQGSVTTMKALWHCRVCDFTDFKSRMIRTQYFNTI